MVVFLPSGVLLWSCGRAWGGGEGSPWRRDGSGEWGGWCAIFLFPAECLLAFAEQGGDDTFNRRCPIDKGVV